MSQGGHRALDIERQDGKYLLRKAINFEVAGNWRRIRPKRCWYNCVKINMDKFGLTPKIAQDCTDWKERISSRATLV